MLAGTILETGAPGTRVVMAAAPTGHLPAGAVETRPAAIAALDLSLPRVNELTALAVLTKDTRSEYWYTVEYPNRI